MVCKTGLYHVTGTASSVRPDGQAAAAQAAQQDLLGDLLDLNDPEPAPAAAAPPSASNNSVQDLLGLSCLPHVIVCFASTPLPLTHSFIHSCIHPFILSLIHSFFHPSIQSCIHSSLLSFILSFTHSFIIKGCLKGRLTKPPRQICQIFSARSQ